MRVHRAFLWYAVVATIALGCAHRGAQPGVAAGEHEPEQGAALEVENNTTLDVRIYLLLGGLPVRLGTVMGMSTAMFDLKPDAIARDIRLFASPVGSRRRTITDPVGVKPGQTVSLRLDNMLRSYRLSVW